MQKIAPEYEVVLPDRDRPAVGFIMDGGRRWSERNGRSLSETYGYSFEKIGSFLRSHRHEISDAAVYALTVYNLRRPADQIDALLVSLPDAVEVFRDAGFAVVVYGDVELLGEEYRRWALEINREACDNSNKQSLLVLATAYSPFWEDYVSSLHAEPGRYGLTRKIIERITAMRFGLVLRTGGGLRLSDFMPRSCGYAELTFDEDLFNEVDLSAWLLEGKERLREAMYGA